MRPTPPRRGYRSPAAILGDLPDADIVHLQALRHGRIVYAFGRCPAATDCEIKDHLEGCVERPGPLPSRSIVEDLQNATTVDADGDGIRPPIELVNVEGVTT